MIYFKSSFVFICVALVSTLARAEIRFEPAGSRIVPLSAQRSAPLPTSSLVTCHHLKWITNQTRFPIEMSVPIQVDQQQQQQQQQQQEETSSYWDWLRLNDFQWVSKMKELLKSYLVTETRDRSSFMILNYDNRTHEQLGSYEPRLRQRVPANNRESVVELSASAPLAPGFTNKRDIFTLAYLKDHYIKTEKFPDRMKVTCYADFLIANTTMVDTIMSLMERYASFKMAVKSTQTKWAGPAPGPRFASHNRNHVRPQQQLQPQQLQQIREMKEQLRQQQLQKIQRLQQQQQMDQQFQQIQQQLQQQQQIKQMQQQQHPLMDIQSIIEKLVSYQQPPVQLLERERQQQLLQRQTQQLIEQHQLIQQQQKDMHQLQRQQQQQQQQQPIAQQVQQQAEQQSLVFKPAEQQVDADDAQPQSQSQQEQQKQDKFVKEKESQQQQQQQQQSQQVDQQSQKQQQVVQQQPIIEQVAQQQQQQQQVQQLIVQQQIQQPVVQQQIQQPIVQQQQQPQQQQQQQFHTQYQQMYHPTHQMLMPMVSHLHPAVYQSDLVNFYNNLFSPNPITYSSPSSYLQQISQQQQYQKQPIPQQQQQQQVNQAVSGESQVLTMSMPLSQQIQQLQQQQPHYPSAGFMLSQTPYDFLFSPRLGKREVRSSMVAGEKQQQQNEDIGKYDYEQDNDESHFLKIRLSLGPISIYRPFEKQEAVSCSLNLINIDTLMSEYHNKIVEMIDTSEYQQAEDEEAYEERLQQHVRKHQNDEPERNDMMFMLDTGKNADPAAEIRKHKTAQQQEEMMNKVRDKSIAELIEMERQLNKMSAMSAAATSSSTFSFVTALICVFIALIF